MEQKYSYSENRPSVRVLPEQMIDSKKTFKAIPDLKFVQKKSEMLRDERENRIKYLSSEQKSLLRTPDKDGDRRFESLQSLMSNRFGWTDIKFFWNNYDKKSDVFFDNCR